MDTALRSDGFRIPEGLIDSDLIALQDAWNKARFRDMLCGEAREAYSRKLLERRLPRVLHFLIDQPKALKALLRVAPRLRPTMTVVSLQQTTNRWGAEGYANVWLTEHGPVSGGLIFTYTDVNGLPAEVYGP